METRRRPRRVQVRIVAGEKLIFGGKARGDLT